MRMNAGYMRLLMLRYLFHLPPRCWDSESQSGSRNPGHMAQMAQLGQYHHNNFRKCSFYIAMLLLAWSHCCMCPKDTVVVLLSAEDSNALEGMDHSLQEHW